jgi:hypothetical protein
VIDLRALAIRSFSLGWWVSFVTGIGIFTTVCLTALFLGRVRGFNAQIGMAICPPVRFNWQRSGSTASCTRRTSLMT